MGGLCQHGSSRGAHAADPNEDASEPDHPEQLDAAREAEACTVGRKLAAGAARAGPRSGHDLGPVQPLPAVC